MMCLSINRYYKIISSSSPPIGSLWVKVPPTCREATEWNRLSASCLYKPHMLITPPPPPKHQADKKRWLC